jgi:hypothetical protein
MTLFPSEHVRTMALVFDQVSFGGQAPNLTHIAVKVILGRLWARLPTWQTRQGVCKARRRNALRLDTHGGDVAGSAKKDSAQQGGPAR